LSGDADQHGDEREQKQERPPRGPDRRADYSEQAVRRIGECTKHEQKHRRTADDCNDQ